MPLHSSPCKCTSPSGSQMKVTVQRNLPGDAGAENAPSLNPAATQSPLVVLLEFSSLPLECQCWRHWGTVGFHLYGVPGPDLCLDRMSLAWVASL